MRLRTQSINQCALAQVMYYDKPWTRFPPYGAYAVHTTQSVYAPSSGRATPVATCCCAAPTSATPLRPASVATGIGMLLALLLVHLRREPDANNEIRAETQVPSPEHKYVDQNSGLTEIYLRFVRPILILM